jgi:indole-3-glycerol phosphate synthase
MQRADNTILEMLARTAEARVKNGYYQIRGERRRETKSLLAALRVPGRIPVIAEVKFRSPSEGTIAGGGDPAEIAKEYERGGAAAVSVLTEPENFGGDIASLPDISGSLDIPVMMKDVIIDPIQVEAAARSGADAVLLISGVLSLGSVNRSMADLVDVAHCKGLEVVAEVHDEAEFDEALRGRADIVGINNRDLRNFSVSLDTSARILLRGPRTKPVICESGICKREDIARLKALGADGFLVGSALMKADDREAALRELIR